MSESVIAAQLDALCAQVGSFQAQIEALRAGFEAYVAVPAQPQEPPPCPHINTQDAGSTLTRKRVRCLDCGQIIEP